MIDKNIYIIIKKKYSKIYTIYNRVSIVLLY